jgi:hypothetical protein
MIKDVMVRLDGRSIPTTGLIALPAQGQRIMLVELKSITPWVSGVRLQGRHFPRRAGPGQTNRDRHDLVRWR